MDRPKKTSPHPYGDLLQVPRPTLKHPRMDRSQRAAQFSSFSVLVGYEELLQQAETAHAGDGNDKTDDF